MNRATVFPKSKVGQKSFKEDIMGTATIQILAGVGVVIILAIIIWRRTAKTSK
jgi:hypothetical protein